MSTYKYQVLFTMSVFHTYFGKEPCRIVSLVPGPVSKKIFARYDFNTMWKEGGFDLYVNAPATIQQYLAHITSATGYTFFDFEMVINDGYFYQYTDFPVDGTGPMFFNSNNVSGANAAGSMQLNMQLQNNAGNPQTGLITINFADILQYTTAQQPAGFAVQFMARSTQWQYYIINRSSLSLDNPAIVGKSPIGFEGPSQVTIPTGEKALLFSSGNTMLPLSIKPHYKFDLVNYNQTQNNNLSVQKTSAYKTIYKGLPNPNPERMGISEVNGQNQVSSPMYVYI